MNNYLFYKKNQFSIRKLSVGVCSVIIGMSFLSGVEAKADTTGPVEATTGQTLPEVSPEDTVIAAEARQAGPEVTTLEVVDQALILENDSIARHFAIEDGKLRTVSVENKLADGGDRVEFEAGSKEFVIQFKETDPSSRPSQPSYTPYSADKSSWTITTNSAANAGASEGAAALAKDNKLGTIWHSNYNNGIGTPNTLPAHVEITFEEAKDIETFIYVPRQDGGQNGLIKDYKIYAKSEGDLDYTEVKAGTITERPSQIQFIDLGRRLTNVKALKFEALTAQNGRPYAAAAEFDVSDQSASQLLADQERRMEDYRKALDDHLAGYQISLDKLRLAERGIERTQTSDGERLTFTFQPYTYQNVPVTIKYVVDLKADSKFSQSHLLISVPEADRDRLTIDTIDLQSFKIKAEDKVHDFSNQAAISEMAGFHGFYAGMGQPIYVRSFYTGSEFPLALNRVEETGRQLISRYYSGKTIGQLGVDEQGNARTWNTVIGVARSDDYQVIQQDFYDYISKIGQDTYFRKQYNSWFDHMLNITAENIQSSFNEIERGFVNGGVSPLHSYVVDDGWQDMTTLWDFNQKFPNKLYDSSKQVKRFGSDFGLWVGPQGGYSQPGYLADHLVRQNLASKHAGVVYIGDKRYVEGMDKLFSDYEREFDINYWKLDGLLLNPRSDTDPNGNFIGGGYGNMYSMTEAHERWIGLYETIRREAKEPDKMWINLTSYIPPSPWFLQWVNSIWMQNANDVDYQDNVKKAAYAHLDFGNDANEAITYRDDRYEELVNLRKWQLPFANIYNHDPVYGNTANSGKRMEPNGLPRPKINFSAEDLRTYLFMLGTRGTGFWEFYYSYNMMDDEKWQVNGEVVNWIEANYDTLKHAKFHGGKPGHGEVYGYSAWDENTGILSIRNPINEEQDYTITLDRLVGVREGTTGMYRTTVHGDKRHDSAATTSYGDTVSLRLKPYETVIFQYSKVADTTAPELLVAKAPAANTITLEFNEPILTTRAQFSVANHTITASQLNKDLRTVTLTLADNLQDRERALVTYSDVADNAAEANLASGQVTVTAYNKGVIEDIVTVDATKPLNHTGVEGGGTFSVTVKANLDQLDQTLAEQDGQWKLAVDGDGRIIFDVKGLQVTSAPFSTLKADDRGVADKLMSAGQETVITAVREKNGGLKLYVDGQLHNTAFDKAKVNENLEKAPLRLASPEFAGSLTRFILEDKARDFVSAAELFEVVSPQTKLVATALAHTTATSYDPDDLGERPASAATDNNLMTYWASDRNEDNTVTPQRLTVELEDSQEVGRVVYTPRQIANAVGNIKRAYLEYSTDGQDWERVAFTNGNEDQTITMKAGIVATPMDFTPVTAKYFRLTALETHHWSPVRVNKVVAAAELTPMVSFTPTLELPLTTAYLRETLYEVAAITPDSYEEQSLARLVTAAESAAAVYDQAENQATIDQANAALKEAIAGLVRKEVPTEPTEPSEPEVPTEPTEPSEPEVPSEPTEPSEPEVPTEPSEPEVPTEPTEPSDPEVPTEPSEPSEPEVPTEPTEPSEPEVPTEPTEPSEPEVPTEPSEPSEPEVPTEPSEPSEPEVPTEPTEPSEPEVPTEPTEPSEPEVPTEPSEPSEPEVPTEPTEPSEPEVPTEPSEPSEPEVPTEPSEPSEPEVPTEPTEPSEPEVPTEPTEPSEPEVPTEPTEPSEPEVPTEPTEPTEPSEPEVPTEPTEPSEPEVPTEPEVPAVGEVKDPVTGLVITLSEGENPRIAGVKVVHIETAHAETPAILAGQDYDLFDIELIDKNGQIIKPNLPAQVELPVDPGKEVDAVVYLPNSNERQNLPFEVKEKGDGRVVVFTAEHFSEYGIVYRQPETVTEPAKPAEPSQPVTPQPSTPAPTEPSQPVKPTAEIDPTVPSTSTPLLLAGAAGSGKGEQAGTVASTVANPAPLAGAAAATGQASLPKTGDSDTAVLALGASALMAALGLSVLRKREN